MATWPCGEPRGWGGGQGGASILGPFIQQAPPTPQSSPRVISGLWWTQNWGWGRGTHGMPPEALPSCHVSATCASSILLQASVTCHILHLPGLASPADALGPL